MTDDPDLRGQLAEREANLQGGLDSWREECQRFQRLWNEERAAREAAEAQSERLQGQVERLKAALPDCKTCGGSGYIEEAAKTSGANQHSACRHVCDDCEGLGVEL
jgi:DnaJ-class molecular chaperone